MEEAQVEVGVGHVAQVSSNGTVLLSAITCPGACFPLHRALLHPADAPTTTTIVDVAGQWAELNNSDATVADFGAEQSFVFSANLVTTGSPSSCVGNSRTVMELQFFTFPQARNISVSDNTTAVNVVSFSVSPPFAKFTLRLFGWPWLSNDTSTNDDRLEVRIDIAPAFTTASQLASTTADVETFELSGQQSTAQPTDGRSRFSTVVHLLKAVKLDGTLLVTGNNRSADERDAVEFRIDQESSQLVLSFARFNSSLEYDPGTTTSFLLLSLSC